VLRSRPLALAVALLSTSAVGGTAAAAARLTPANSIAFEFFAGGNEDLSGTNCGGTATVTKPLPAGATGIKVTEPKVGARDDGGGTRVTAVAVNGTVVTVTIVADGPSICDPAETGVPAGEPVNWRADYDVRAVYKRRVQATIRVFYESYSFGAKWKLRPKTIRDSRAGAPPGARVTGIKWKRFGGKTAVGWGRLRLDDCPRGGNCPGNGKRVRLVASKPDYCKDSGKIEYLKLAWDAGKLYQVRSFITCSD
jgi:hypothetical protein